LGADNLPEIKEFDRKLLDKVLQWGSGTTLPKKEMENLCPIGGISIRLSRKSFLKLYYLNI
jgi:hypothetical protein